MTISVKGGFWGQYGATMTLTRPYTSMRRLARVALNTYGMYALREKMETLNGAAAGSTATKQLKRVVAAEDMSGVRAIENQTFVNTATVAGDITEINDSILALSSKTYDSTPPANLDGNPLGTR